MAFYNTGARYLFSLAREGVLPAAARPHAPKASSPVVASMVVTAISRLLLGFTLYDSSTEAALLKLATWSPLLGVLGHPRRAGALLGRDHPLLPAPTARDGLPLVEDAARARRRRSGHVRRLLPADRQPRRARRGGRARLHPGDPVLRPRRVRRSASRWPSASALRARRPARYAGLGRFVERDPPSTDEPDAEPQRMTTAVDHDDIRARHHIRCDPLTRRGG